MPKSVVAISIGFMLVSGTAIYVESIYLLNSYFFY